MKNSKWKKYASAAMAAAMIPAVVAPIATEASEIRGLHTDYNIVMKLDGKKVSNWDGKTIRLANANDLSEYYTVNFTSNFGKFWVPAGATYNIYDITNSDKGAAAHKEVTPASKITVYKNGGTTVGTLNYYSVEFFSDNETMLEEATVLSGNKVQQPVNPTDETKTFVGWVDENGNKFDFNAPITKQTKVYAQWSKPVYVSDVAFKSGHAYYEHNGGAANNEKGVIKDYMNYSKRPITLLVNGESKVFTKGLGTHAPATVVYDLTDKNITRFTSYAGVNASQTKGRVTLQVYVDGILVDSVTDIKATEEAKFFDIDLTDAKELKLVAVQIGNGVQNMAVWGDAKFYQTN